MKFKVEKKIFERLPTLYIGVVVANEIDNSRDYPEIDQFLHSG